MTDAELVRYLDGEVDEVQRKELEDRIARDAASAERLEMLTARTREFSAWLNVLGPEDDDIAHAARAIRPRLAHRPAPVARRRAWRRLFGAAPPLLRAAAVVLVVASAALALPASRAWVVRALERAALTLGLAPARETPPDADTGPDVTHSFAFSGTTFVLEVTGTPAGELVIERNTAGLAAAEVRGGPGARLTVLPQGLRIESAGEAEARFEVRLPAAVRQLRLRVAGSDEVTYDLGNDAAWRRAVPLRESPTPAR